MAPHGDRVLAMMCVEPALNDKRKLARMVNEDIRDHGLIQPRSFKKAALIIKVNKHLDEYFKALAIDYEADVAFIVNWGKGEYHCPGSPVTELMGVY